MHDLYRIFTYFNILVTKKKYNALSDGGSSAQSYVYTVSTQLNILDTKLIVSEENPQPLFINPVPIMMSPPHLLKPGRVSLLLRLQHNWDASSFSPFVGLDVSLPGRQNNIQVYLERKEK